jgi:hypothetical protein
VKPKKRKAGIFNPYKKEEEVVEEKEDKEESDTVHLTGDPYSIVIENTSLKNVPENLGLLLATLSGDADLKDALERHGVSLTRGDADHVKSADQAVLVTSHGRIRVFVGSKSDNLEDEVFRRLGHALYLLNRDDIYKAHNIHITKRG